MSLTKKVESRLDKAVELYCHINKEKEDEYNDEHDISHSKDEESSEEFDMNAGYIIESEEEDDDYSFEINIDADETTNKLFLAADSVSSEEKEKEKDVVNIRKSWKDLKKEYYFYYNIKKYKLSSKGDKKQKFKYIVITILDDELLSTLKKIMTISELYTKKPNVGISYLYYAINDIRIRLKGKHNSYKLYCFTKFVEYIFKLDYDNMDKMIDANKIDYKSLWYYYDKVDTIYKVKYLDTHICYKHESFSYSSDDSKTKHLALNGYIYYYGDNGLLKSLYTHKITWFKGTKDISSFENDIQVLTKEEDIDMFNKYGLKTLKYQKGFHHMHLDGKQYMYDKEAIASVYKNVRIMVDEEGMKKYGTRAFYYSEMNALPIVDEDIPEGEKVLVFPYISCYNLGANKLWGMAHINNIKEINYKKDAYNILVMDETKKSIIKGLINMHNKTDYEDVIEGKGKGLIFLLYGPPGVGKTLTAEASCEFLERPLYILNVGDLGTNVETMETIMTRVLEYATRWNAIILIDEVDIFIEIRDSHNTHSNAMVCTFLKFLEYNTGIMFLTTNRLRALDPAAKDRVNLCLHYEDLTHSRRSQIWTELLKSWKIECSKKFIKKLASKPMNGRSIRITMKNVLSLLKNDGLEVNESNIYEKFTQCLDLQDEFENNTQKSMYT